MERDELKSAVSEAVREALVDHPCYFSVAERPGLHRVAEMNTDQIDSIRLIGKAVSGAAAKVGQFLVLSLLAAAILIGVILVRLGVKP